MSSKTAQVETLEERLHNGFVRIGEAMQQGIDVTNWERHWCELLREYESLSDALAAAKPEQSEMALGVRRKEAA